MLHNQNYRVTGPSIICSKPSLTAASRDSPLQSLLLEFPNFPASGMSILATAQVERK